MPKDIGEGLLNHAVHRSFEFRSKPGETRLDVHRCIDSASFGQSFYIPVDGRAEAYIVKQRRMQEMRNVAHLLQGAFNQSSGIIHSSYSFDGDGVDSHLGGNQCLPQAVMHLPRDAASLFILYRNHSSCQASHLAVQNLQLARLTMPLSEHLNFRPQQFRDDGNGNVIYRAELVSLELVIVAQVHSRDEDDRRVAKARMLTNHFCQLKSILLRHTDVHENHGNVTLEKIIKRFSSALRFDQIFP